jgi:hypothetical protein
MAYGRRETDAEGVVLAVKIVLSVIGIIVMEVLAAGGLWSGWLNWWSGPLVVLGFVWGGFWFFMWLWEVVTDA